MKRAHPDLLWCRYADDGLVHCRTEQQAETFRVRPKSSSSQTKLSEHEANRGGAEKTEGVSIEIFPILGQPTAAIERSEPEAPSNEV